LKLAPIGNVSFDLKLPEFKDKSAENTLQLRFLKNRSLQCKHVPDT